MTQPRRPFATTMPFPDKHLVDGARRVYKQLADGDINVKDAKQAFTDREHEFRTMSDSALALRPSNPRLVAGDVRSQMARGCVLR